MADRESFRIDSAAPDDADIAQCALHALGELAPALLEAVHVAASGKQNAPGGVEWPHRRHAVEAAAGDFDGARGITSPPAVKPGVQATAVRRRIEAAFRQSAEADAQKVLVETAGTCVTLRGTIRSWADHEDALNAARSTPGVTAVEDRLTIRP